MTRPSVAALGLATAWLPAACSTVRVEPGQGGGAASTSTGTATHSSTGTSTPSTTASGGAGGAPVDYFEITVDGAAIYRVDATSPRCGVAAYERTLVDMSAFADGEAHLLRLHAETYRHVDVSTFFVDLVSLPSCPAGSGGAGGAPGCAETIADPSFEAGTPNPSWHEFSVNFGTPLCDASCGSLAELGPADGQIWAWFANIGGYEQAWLEQEIVIAPGADSLSLFLALPTCAYP